VKLVGESGEETRSRGRQKVLEDKEVGNDRRQCAQGVERERASEREREGGQMAASGSSLSVLATNSANSSLLQSSQTYQLPRSQSSPARGASRRYGFSLEDEEEIDDASSVANSDENSTVVASYANMGSSSVTRQTKQRGSSKPLPTSQSARTQSKTNSRSLVYIDPVESLLNEYEERRKKIVMVCIQSSSCTIDD